MRTLELLAGPIGFFLAMAFAIVILFNGMLPL